MEFEVIGDITGTQTIATSSGIRELGRLRKRYGRGRWRKRKGFAEIRLPSGENSPSRVTLVRSHWHRKTRNEDQGVHIKQRTYGKSSKTSIYLSQ
jgi:hypothetical protein